MELNGEKKKDGSTLQRGRADGCARLNPGALNDQKIVLSLLSAATEQELTSSENNFLPVVK